MYSMTQTIGKGRRENLTANIIFFKLLLNILRTALQFKMSFHTSAYFIFI